jgi:hypothetical protein
MELLSKAFSLMAIWKAEDVAFTQMEVFLRATSSRIRLSAKASSLQ